MASSAGSTRPSYFPLHPGRHRVLGPLLEPASVAAIDSNRGPPRVHAAEAATVIMATISASVRSTRRTRVATLLTKGDVGVDQNPVPVPAATVVYTDGACSQNPGPGGWAWAVPRGRYASGARPRTTNQRMELMAVLEAAKALDGPLEVVSDSTYVINCFRDRWWEGWLQRDWTNSQKGPVVNRDLWEPLIEIVRQRGITFRWVKGHSGDPMNELVDQLAGEAARTQQGRQGVAAELGHTKLRRK